MTDATPNIAPALLESLVAQAVRSGQTVEQAVRQIRDQALRGELDDVAGNYNQALLAIDESIRAAAQRAAG